MISSRSYLHVTPDCNEYIDPSKTRILGSCTGLLAGIAASSSRGLSDLPILGVTLVRVAFRTGVLVAGLRDLLQQGPTSQESWSTVFAGLSENAMKDALKKIHADNVRTETAPLKYFCTDLKIDHAIIGGSVYQCHYLPLFDCQRTPFDIEKVGRLSVRIWRH